jgi:hypothetical protein
MGKGHYERKALVATHPCAACGKLFKYEKAAAKCPKKCMKAQPVLVGSSLDVVALLEKMNSRILALESELKTERAARILADKRLEERFGRGTYTMRTKNVGVPKIGWGNFTQHDFLEGSRMMRAYLESEKMKIMSWHQVICGPWFQVNGARVVSLIKGCAVDRFDRPLRVRVNRKGAQREVSLDYAINTIFKTQWLPEWDEIYAIFGDTIVEDSIEQSYNRIRNFTMHQSSNKAKQFDSYKVRFEVLEQFAIYSLPKIWDTSKVSSDQRLKRSQESWDDLVKETQFWWTCEDPESLAENYDDFFKEFPLYGETLKEYFSLPTTNPDKKPRYIKAGGTHY